MRTVHATLLIFAITMQLSSCYIRRDFTPYCYKETNTKLSSILNLNGYFSWKEVAKKSIGYHPNIKTVLDTIERNCIFYESGIFIFAYYKEHFQKEKPIGYKGGMAWWGSYIVCHDTIKAFVMPPPGDQISSSFFWFKVIDKNTIKELCYKGPEPITQQDVINYLENPPEWRVSQTDGKFIPYDSLPDPNLSWIKKKKWFWCDEKQYKEWKRNRRIRKK